MEISIPLSGVFQFSPPPVVKTVSTEPTPIAVSGAASQVQLPVTGSTASTGNKEPTPSTDTGASSQETSQAATLQAALSNYAISSTASSTYKDANGTLITITRDYKTGKATYTPEPQYVRSPQTNVSVVA